VGRGFVDHPATAPFELAAAEDVPSADDDGDLATQVMGLLDLPRNGGDLIHADPTLAGMRQAFAR
jgi:hypothetical protein